jgi:ankyrin repeat protein
MAAAYGKSDLLRVLLDFGLEPKGDTEETPPPFCLAAVNGHLDAFALLETHLDLSESVQFQLAQLLVWGMADKVASEEFKELLGRIPLEKVSELPLCDSTLLQHLAYMGKRTAVALLLQNGVDPMVTTERNEKTAEDWASSYSKVGVLVELAKVKEISADIMSSDIWSKVHGEQMLAMGERICSLLEKNSLGAEL